MSHLIEVSVDDLGRILIPAEVQSHLGLTPGMILMVEKGDDDGLRLSLQSQSSELVDKGGVLVVRAEPLADLNDITRYLHFILLALGIRFYLGYSFDYLSAVMSSK